MDQLGLKITNPRITSELMMEKLEKNLNSAILVWKIKGLSNETIYDILINDKLELDPFGMCFDWKFYMLLKVD
jgi:hypothetical protein